MAAIPKRVSQKPAAVDCPPVEAGRYPPDFCLLDSQKLFHKELSADLSMIPDQRFMENIIKYDCCNLLGQTCWALFSERSLACSSEFIMENRSKYDNFGISLLVVVGRFLDA